MYNICIYVYIYYGHMFAHAHNSLHTQPGRRSLSKTRRNGNGILTYCMGRCDHAHS